jgi:hypothetical protein
LCEDVEPVGASPPRSADDLARRLDRVRPIGAANEIPERHARHHQPATRPHLEFLDVVVGGVPPDRRDVERRRLREQQDGRKADGERC